MEFIVPLFIIFISSFVAAGVTSRLTRTWTRGRSAAVVTAFLLPGLYVGYLLGVLHLRDDYHRRHSETYNFDGNCVVALGHGYRLEFFDEFPDFARVVREASGTANYNDDGSSVLLVEDGVRRVGLKGLSVYGAASGREAPLDKSIDHYFWVDLAQGRAERFKSEAELHSKVQGLGQMVGPDELFSSQEKRERSSIFTWTILFFPIVFAILLYRWMKRWQATIVHDDPSLLPRPSRG